MKTFLNFALVRSAVILVFALISNASATTFHYVDANGTNPVAPFTNWGTAATNIQDAVFSASSSDHILVTNGVYRFGSGGPPGIIAQVLSGLTVESVNGPSVTIIDGQAAKRCVYLADGAVLSGFTVTNGVSNSSSCLSCQTRNSVVTNCFIVGNNQTLSGLSAINSGTIINCVISNNLGGGASGCTLINCTLTGNSAHDGGGASGCTLINCNLTGNSAISGGGGAYSCTLLNCVLSGNRAGYIGGGAAVGTLANCVLFGNYSTDYAGGASAATLINCTVVSNSSGMGPGGVYTSHIFNSILYYNSTPFASDANYGGFSISNSCTTPLPPGADNFTNAPLFVDLAGGDFHLQPGSPCINAGNNACLVPIPPLVPSITNDFDGHARVVGGTVDIGAYEFQSPASVLSYAWLQKYGFPTDGSADFLDSDGDQMNNWQEWLAGTNPTNSSSVLRMLTPTGSAPNVTLSWQSVTNRT